MSGIAVVSMLHRYSEQRRTIGSFSATTGLLVISCLLFFYLATFGRQICESSVKSRHACTRGNRYRLDTILFSAISVYTFRQVIKSPFHATGSARTAAGLFSVAGPPLCYCPQNPGYSCSLVRAMGDRTMCSSSWR